MLTFGGLMLLGGRMGDTIGRKRTFIVGVALAEPGGAGRVGAVTAVGWRADNQVSGVCSARDNTTRKPKS